ncbi:type II secretion system F family protein [Thermosediminibacter litoriperuensis]|uniref:Tight adherence protein B n=1 Tax=Thermosediminibacter litoriperuensis TaxID=291989 RepID=A0A5S5AVR2_9FIRM|nr:hypothetical protein [Thermosediminibacter litoriperuensis]TYP56818.1 tight adherence protein B [Thermosediminibacter litoriperuensis]
MPYVTFLQFAILFVLIYTAAVNIERAKFRRRFFESYFSRYRKAFSFLESRSIVLKGIDALLARSGMKGKLPFLDAKNMAFISCILFLASLCFFRRLGFATLFYAVALVYIPYAGMMFLSSVNARKIKSAYLTFLSTFIGFYNIEGNIINALKSTAAYVSEPLRSILKRNVFLFEKTQRSIAECLDNIAIEAGDKEFRKFINFAKMNAKYGGNFGKALTKLREQAEKLHSLEAIKSANASVGSLVIFFMIVINLVLMFNISNDPEVATTIRNTVTGQAIAVCNAAAVIFGLYMIKNINSSA